MQKKFFTILTIVAVGLSLTLSCGKKKSEESPTTYTEVCRKITSCDKSTTQLTAMPLACEKLFAGIEEKLSDKGESFNKIIKCINDTPCEKLNASVCLKGALPSL